MKILIIFVMMVDLRLLRHSVIWNLLCPLRTIIVPVISTQCQQMKEDFELWAIKQILSTCLYDLDQWLQGHSSDLELGPSLMFIFGCAHRGSTGRFL